MISRTLSVHSTSTKDTTRPFTQLSREIFDTLHELVGMGTIDEINMERAQRLADSINEYTFS